MTVLERFAETLIGFDQARLSDQDCAALSLHLLDTVGATLAGVATPDGRAALTFRHVAGASSVQALGDAPLDDVATACTLTRMSEIDDIHLASGTTPGSIVVPAALALSAHLNIGRAPAFAEAAVAGYEAMTRLGAAIDGASLIYRGILTTYFVAPVGTAAVAARLLGLDQARTAHALAIALTMLSGRLGRPGGGRTSRWLVIGQAARAGCFAALTAARDFAGDIELLDGRWLETAHGVPCDPDVLLAPRVGESVLPEISLKPFCSAKQAVAAIAGFERILASGIDPRSIDAVEVSVPEAYARMIDHGVVAGDRLSSLTSAPHQLAMAAFHRDALYDVARDAPILDGEVASFMEKVSVAVDPSLARHMPGRWPAAVRVGSGGGTETITVVDGPGDPGDPLDEAATRDKFRRVTQAFLAPGEAETWMDLAAAAAQDDASLQALQQRFRTLITG